MMRCDTLDTHIGDGDAANTESMKLYTCNTVAKNSMKSWHCSDGVAQQQEKCARIIRTGFSNLVHENVPVSLHSKIHQFAIEPISQYAI